MGIQKEFEDWYKKHHHNQIGSFDGEYYANSYQHTMWVGWQAAKASAVPEGFVLMPIKPSEGMIVAVRKCHEGEAYLPHSLYSEFVNQARIEAQEPSNDS